MVVEVKSLPFEGLRKKVKQIAIQKYKEGLVRVDEVKKEIKYSWT